MSDDQKLTIPKSYNTKGPVIELDGKPFLHFLEGGGPRVEAIPGAESLFHILWLPVLIKAPLPAYVTEAPGIPVKKECPDHKPVQHRDFKPPWCETCGEFGGGGGWLKGEGANLDGVAWAGLPNPGVSR